MGFELAVLILKIEHYRNDLYSLISNNNLTDPNVVSCSQKLDKLLTRYEQMRPYIQQSAA
ncbi:aspartyl-phosphate phosphatase Spo0E family protein [Clostridium guangxiense]|uniref:aspartyl-phosphate phosphatase Spo0E family protein n=1 Tax=Clostridium guangxiense TaxID=1662055 RepID=UPI001E65D185|nr:aspartyl-phosphate phosphatase Spo0E family protein [Clostridium guangxiense]MCD2348797.1 aspartyl-phosphate phosphatase Spo0E family protein [Clostridium guangxiense]